MFRGTLRPRIAFEYALYLRSGSATIAEKRGGQEFRDYDETRYLSIGTFNVLQQLLYAFVSAHTERSVPKPKLWPMPKDKNETREEQPGGFAAMLNAARARRAQRQAAQLAAQNNEQE